MSYQFRFQETCPSDEEDELGKSYFMEADHGVAFFNRPDGSFVYFMNSPFNDNYLTVLFDC